METKRDNFPNNRKSHSKYYQHPHSYEGLHVIHMSELKQIYFTFGLDVIQIQQCGTITCVIWKSKTHPSFILICTTMSFHKKIESKLIKVWLHVSCRCVNLHAFTLAQNHVVNCYGYIVGQVNNVQRVGVQGASWCLDLRE